MRSHSVTGHPTQVNTRPVLDLTTPEGWIMEGYVDLGDWLHTEMVYPPADGHPSKY